MNREREQGPFGNFDKTGKDSLKWWWMPDES